MSTTLLEQLRAAGAEPVSDEYLESNARFHLIEPPSTSWEARLAADLLEARAKLKRVTERATTVKTIESYSPLGCRNDSPAFIGALGDAWSAGHRAACWEILGALGWTGAREGHEVNASQVAQAVRNVEPAPQMLKIDDHE